MHFIHHLIFFKNLKQFGNNYFERTAGGYASYIILWCYWVMSLSLPAAVAHLCL